MTQPIKCGRCNAPCKVGGPGNPDAKMLRLSAAEGLCINCAVHDFLRNCYPANMGLAENGPASLLCPSVQEVFAGLMKVACADARPEEIDWQAIVDNWDLPFPKKIKRSAMNPVSQAELDDIAAGRRRGLGEIRDCKSDPLGGKMTIASFEELNLLEEGSGDDLKAGFDR